MDVPTTWLSSTQISLVSLASMGGWGGQRVAEQDRGRADPRAVQPREGVGPGASTWAGS